MYVCVIARCMKWWEPTSIRGENDYSLSKWKAQVNLAELVPGTVQLPFSRSGGTIKEG